MRPDKLEFYLLYTVRLRQWCNQSYHSTLSQESMHSFSANLFWRRMLYRALLLKSEIVNAWGYMTNKTNMFGSAHHEDDLKHVVATSPLALRWMYDSPRTGCARRITPIYMWRKQAIIEWSWHVISIVVCCHSVELCALAARAFRSQQTWSYRVHQTPHHWYRYVLRSTAILYKLTGKYACWSLREKTNLHNTVIGEKYWRMIFELIQ